MKNNKKLAKKEIKITKQDRINHLRRGMSTPGLFFRQEEDMFKNYFEKKDKLSKEGRDDIANELVQLYGLENGYWIGNISHQKYNPPLIRMKKVFIEENECKGSIELMLADKIVASYWRVMKYEQVFNHFIQNKEGVFNCSQLNINMLK